MNVPLKKRHNYGKLNGSTTSLNQPSAKRLHSSEYTFVDHFATAAFLFIAFCFHFMIEILAYSNYDDSEYEHQSSNMDESLLNRPATLGCFPRGD